MKRLPAALLLIFALRLPSSSFAMEDARLAWGRNDTSLHMATAFAGSLAGTELLRWCGWSKPKAVLGASLAMAGAGLLKEFVVDRSPSGSDLMADGIGIGGQALFQFTVRFDWPWDRPGKARPGKPEQ